MLDQGAPFPSAESVRAAFCRMPGCDDQRTRAGKFFLGRLERIETQLEQIRRIPHSRR
jgi:hypothetical protein